MYERQLEITVECGDVTEIKKSLGEIVEFQKTTSATRTSHRNLKHTLEIYRHTLAIIEARGDRKLATTCMDVIAEIHELLGETKLSIDMHKHSLSMKKKLSMFGGQEVSMRNIKRISGK
jgi:hypothetical protein